MKQQLILSHSKRMLWQQCHRKYKYSYVMGLKPEHLPRAMHMGTTTHAAIEAWLKQPELASEIVQTVRNVDVHLGQALDTYFTKHSADEDLVTLRTSVAFNERLFDVESADGPVEVRLAGELDALAVWKKNKTLWVVERKSTGQIPSNLVTRFNLDDQVRGYTYIVRRRWMLPAEGAIEDIIRFTKNTELVRDFVQVEDWMLDEWYEDMVGIAQEIIDAEHEDRYPMSPHSCHVFGTCAFNSLCLNPDRISYATEMGYLKEEADEHEHGLMGRALDAGDVARLDADVRAAIQSMQ